MTEIITTAKEHQTIESLMKEMESRGRTITNLQRSEGDKTVGHIMGEGKGPGMLHHANDTYVDHDPCLMPVGTKVRVIKP